MIEVVLTQRIPQANLGYLSNYVNSSKIISVQDKEIFTTSLSIMVCFLLVDVEKCNMLFKCPGLMLFISYPPGWVCTYKLCPYPIGSSAQPYPPKRLITCITQQVIDYQACCCQSIIIIMQFILKIYMCFQHLPPGTYPTINALRMHIKNFHTICKTQKWRHFHLLNRAKYPLMLQIHCARLLDKNTT